MTIKTNGVGMPKNVPFPTRMNCSGKPETETPSVMPIAMPLKSVIVASVARIGVTSNLAIKIELMPPAISPTMIPSTQAMRIHIKDSVPVVSLLLRIT